MEIFLSKTISYEMYYLLRLEPCYHIIGKLLYLFFNNKRNREVYKKEEEYYFSLDNCDFKRASQCVEEMENLGLSHSPRLTGMEVTLSLEKIRNHKENNCGY